MPWMKWLPWRFMIRRVARAHRFLDPIAVLARLHRFAQPSEVAEPVELLRAGMVFHARGLINSRVIQHNLDWVWPYWVERQFDPTDDAFIPRAFTLTHVNLTHRNWTAVGLPDCDELPIVDPRGLLTPFWDKWSLDAWILTRTGQVLLPSRQRDAVQRLDFTEGLAVVTETTRGALKLSTRASVRAESGGPVCALQIRAYSDQAAWMVAALRPYNPEGTSFIYDIELAPDRRTWRIDGLPAIRFDDPVPRHHVSSYRNGDVYLHLRDAGEEKGGKCEVGMATAAALFDLEPGTDREIVVRIPLQTTNGRKRPRSKTAQKTSMPWDESLRTHCRLRTPDERVQFLYEAALRTIILTSPEEVYPGPYTYKRFWYRDAAFIIHALLCAGLTARAERALHAFPDRQDRNGYFRSQEGEWDSNGEVLWIMNRFRELTGRPPPTSWRLPILRGARWIGRKRTVEDGRSPHAGLLPAGFSAEHLGPSDYYYWDDFWGIAGLMAAEQLADAFGETKAAREFQREAQRFLQAVEHSLKRVAERINRPGMPASPYRRLDAGAIGSLVASYPLQLFAPGDPRTRDTVTFLLDQCFIDSGFFQDMIHSGINPYLTLHVAQVLLRADDPRYVGLMSRVAELASPTGQWPEAIHPRTGGGCMGDGQHAWAAAEWIMMVRSCFVREEGAGLVLGSGIPRPWLAGGETVSLGPTPTAFGPITVVVKPGAIGQSSRRILSWQATWRQEAPPIDIRVPGYRRAVAEPGQESIELSPESVE